MHFSVYHVFYSQTSQSVIILELWWVTRLNTFVFLHSCLSAHPEDGRKASRNIGENFMSKIHHKHWRAFVGYLAYMFHNNLSFAYVQFQKLAAHQHCMDSTSRCKILQYLATFIARNIFMSTANNQHLKYVAA
jgi:hypothetical protein